MTSTPAIAPAPAPIDSAPTAAASGPNQDFASALSGVAAKPTPKSAAGKIKAAVPAGAALPAGGIVSPPPPPVIPVVAAEATVAMPARAAPAAALAAAVLQRLDAEGVPAAVPATARSGPAGTTASAALDGTAPEADAKTFLAPVAAASPDPSIATEVPAAPSAAPVAPVKAIVPRVSALEDSPVGDTHTEVADGSAAPIAPPAAASAPAIAPDLVTGSAADAARAAAAVVVGAPDATSNASAGTNSLANAVNGLTAAAANAQQDTAAATLTASAVKAATAIANINVLSTATAQDKRVHPSDAPSTSETSSGIADPAQLGVNSTSTQDASPAATMNVSPHVETPEFGQGVAERVSWMVDNNVSSAKLQVNPPQLGPIEVRIALQGGHAQVWMTSHSAVTRDALESSSSKLREALGAQGFGQVSVDISQRSFQDRPSHSQPYEWTPSAGRGASTASVAAASVTPRNSSGLLDAYA